MPFVPVYSIVVPSGGKRAVWLDFVLIGPNLHSKSYQFPAAFKLNEIKASYLGSLKSRMLNAHSYSSLLRDPWELGVSWMALYCWGRGEAEWAKCSNFSYALMRFSWLCSHLRPCSLMIQSLTKHWSISLLSLLLYRGTWLQGFLFYYLDDILLISSFENSLYFLDISTLSAMSLTVSSSWELLRESFIEKML